VRAQTLSVVTQKEVECLLVVVTHQRTG
jgi:hypothetical protein